MCFSDCTTFVSACPLRPRYFRVVPSRTSKVSSLVTAHCYCLHLSFPAVSSSITSSLKCLLQSPSTANPSLPIHLLACIYTALLLFSPLSLVISFFCPLQYQALISNSLPCCPLRHNTSPTCVIQGDLQPSVLSVLNAVCSHFDYFQVRHTVFVRDVTETLRHTVTVLV